MFNKPKADPILTLRHLRPILRQGAELLPQDGDWDALLYAPHQPRLLLGHYSVEMLRERLEYYGLIARLREKGFDPVDLRLDLSDPARQQIMLYEGDSFSNKLLAEASIADGLFETRGRAAKALKGHRHYMLFIQWLCLQNPGAMFTPRRPALPGQNYPGLKVGREVMALLVALADKLGMAGLINVPEFPHAAVLYSERFRYFNPILEGQLRALQRDLAEVPLAKTSWGVMLGCVRETRGNHVFHWFREEQVLPLASPWVAHFESPWYSRTAEHAQNRHHFVFDEERWNLVNPLAEDGSPRIRLERPRFAT